MTVRLADAATARTGIDRLAVWAALALSVVAIPLTAFHLTAFDYQYHAWVSAHFATMARSFADHGIFALGGVPIQNNDPLTTQPDAYLNFPPLYPIVLSLVFRLWGSSPVIVHLFAGTVALGVAALVFIAVRRDGGPATAALATVAFLNAPIVARYGHVGLHLTAALLLCLASLILFTRAIEPERDATSRRWHGAGGAICLYAAVCTSWEPALAPVGLAVVAALRRDRRAFRLAILYGAAGCLAFASVMALYAVQYPQMMLAVFDRALLRAGIGGVYRGAAFLQTMPHLLQETTEREGVPRLIDFLEEIFVHRMVMLGPLGLAAVAASAITIRSSWRIGNSHLAYICSGLVGMYVLWTVLMRNHMFIHEYEGLVLAPVAGLCVGQIVAWGSSAGGFELGRHGRALVSVGLLTLLSTALLARADESYPLLTLTDGNLDRDIAFARFVRDHVAADAIVVQPSPNMVPVYYSERHTIRGVENEAVLVRSLPSIEALCRDCPIYVAIADRDDKNFRSTLQTQPQAVAPGLGTLVRLSR